MLDGRVVAGAESLACAAALTSVMFAGCGSSASTLDTKPVETAVVASILAQRGVHTTVRCPRGVPLKSGAVFTCVAMLDAGTYPVTATETDGSGHVRYENRAPLVILDTPRVERAIAASILAQRHLSASVSCPSTVLQHAGLLFTCAATIAGRNYPFDVREVNSRGRVQFVGR